MGSGFESLPAHQGGQLGKQILSIVIHYHNEDLKFLDSAISSADYAADKLTKSSRFQILKYVLADAPQTLEEITDFASSRGWELIKCNFNSLARAKNYFIDSFEFSYVTFLDCDDLMGNNWILEIDKLMEKNKLSQKKIYRPQTIIYFKENLNQFIKIQHSSRSLNSLVNRKRIETHNLWASPFLCSKYLLKKNPYQYKEDEVYWEDWDWNINILNKNIEIKVIGLTYWQVRLRPGSLSFDNLKNNYRNKYKLNLSYFNLILSNLINLSKKISSIKFLRMLAVKFSKKVNFVNEKWYLRAYLDVRKSGLSPTEHYISYGRWEGRFRKKPSFINNNLISGETDIDIRRQGW